MLLPSAADELSTTGASEALVEKREAPAVSERYQPAYIGFMNPGKGDAIRRLEEAADHELRAAAPPGIARSFELISLVTARCFDHDQQELQTGE